MRAEKRWILFVVALSMMMVIPLAVYSEDENLNSDNVVIVLDSSGSMGDSMPKTGMKKMDAAKSALEEVLKNVPMKVNIGLLVFSARNVHDDWIYPLGPRDDQRLVRAIHLPQPGDGTPLGMYIKKGMDCLLSQRSKQKNNGTYRLLIVTDGEAHDRDLVDRVVPSARGKGIKIDVIGVAMSAKHTLATKVDSYRAADDPESLKKAIAEVFAELSASSSDAANEEAFAQIAPIPDEMAREMLKAIASGATKIEQPNVSSSAAPQKPQQPAVVVRPPARPRPPVQPPPPPSARKSGSLWVTFVAFMLVFSIFVRRKKNRSKWPER